MNHKENIEKLKQELREKYAIDCDRTMFKQLGLSDEDKKKVLAWIEYQCAYARRDGYEEGQREIKERIGDLLFERDNVFILK